MSTTLNTTGHMQEDKSNITKAKTKQIKTSKNQMANRSIDNLNRHDDLNRRLAEANDLNTGDQARYVERWLDESSYCIGLTGVFGSRPPSSLSESPSQTSWSSSIEIDGPGNIVGIRSFTNKSLDSLTRAKKRHQSDQHHRFRYSKLKTNYLKLSQELANIRNYIDKSINNLKSCNCDKRQSRDELQNIKDLLITKHKILDDPSDDVRKYPDYDKRCNIPSSNDLSRELIDQLRSNWQREREELIQELDQTRLKLANCEKSDLPSQNAINFLRRDNDKLKAQLDRDAIEFSNLKQDYIQLENRLRIILEDEKLTSQTKHDEVAKIRLELCRLQVYQPKLEQILETERAIKSELQKQLDKLQIESNQYKEQLETCQKELNHERCRARNIESSDMQNMVCELAKWQEKFRLLQRNLWQGEERSRSLEAKLEQMESRRISELETIQVQFSREKADLYGQLSRLETERNSLQRQLLDNEKLIKNLEQSNEQFKDKLQTCCRELELSRGLNERSGLTIEKLETDSTNNTKLLQQVRELELRHRQASSDFQAIKIELESTKRELGHAKQQLMLQQRTHHEFRERKEKELARLRIGLNFEQYQRRIALESIEKELKSSVRELEAMKCKFGRLNQ